MHSQARIFREAKEIEQKLENNIQHYTDTNNCKNGYLIFRRAMFLVGFFLFVLALIAYFTIDKEKPVGSITVGCFGILFCLIGCVEKAIAALDKWNDRNNGVFDPNTSSVVCSLNSNELKNIQVLLQETELSEIKVDNPSDGQQMRKTSQALSQWTERNFPIHERNVKLNTTLFKALPEDMPPEVGNIIFGYVEEPFKNKL